MANDIGDAKIKFKNFPFQINWQESSVIDFDKFLNILYSLSTTTETSTNDCNTLNNGWNFLEDMLKTFSCDDTLQKSQDPKIKKPIAKYFGELT
ncbi:MAG: hypothetical protein ACQ9MH_11475 [Nitrospinales bacterium]